MTEGADVIGALAIGVLPPMLITGVGLGVAFPALMIFAMWGTDAGDAGIASGIVNTRSEAGGAFGLAVFATVGGAVGAHRRVRGRDGAACLLLRDRVRLDEK